MVVFAFVGIEMVGLTVGETSNPEENLPKAINSLPIRIGLFYVGSMIAIMSVYPWDKITTNVSPFVQVFSGIGIAGAAGILNFVVLTAAMSATNSAIFSTSRTLHALASGGNAPKRFRELDKRAVPSKALNVSSLILFVIVVLNFVMPAQIFTLISGVSTINFVFVWVVLLWCHLKYRQQHRDDHPSFTMPGYPLTDYLTLIFFIGILIYLFFVPETRVSLIISIIWFIALAIIYQVTNRKRN